MPESERKYICQECGGEFSKDYMLWSKDCHGIVFRHLCLRCYDKAMAKGYDGQYYTELDECLDADY